MSAEATRALVTISRAYASLERDGVCCGTVTVSQCMVLQTLLDGPADLSTLSAAVGLSNSAGTRLVDSLEQRSLVVRERDPSDRRRVVAVLTAAGRDEAARLRALTEQAVTGVLDLIAPGERAQVVHSLELLATAIARVDPGVWSCS